MAPTTPSYSSMLSGKGALLDETLAALGPFDSRPLMWYTTGGGEVVVMKLKLYYSTVQQPLDNPANHAFSEAIDILADVQKQGIRCEKIDTAELPHEKVYEAYADAWAPAVSKKFAIRRVFGTRRRSGCFFGREVPALLVYEDGSRHPVDVYPQEKLGRTITIRDYLTDLLADSKEIDL